MKKILIYTFLIIGWLVPRLCLAQETASYPIETIDGQSYYRYTVERSIGLYRISVNFGVKQEEILAANPSLKKRGLRYGEEILIPIKQALVAAAPTPTVESTAAQVVAAVDTIVAVVKESMAKAVEDVEEKRTLRKRLWRVPTVEWDEEKVDDTPIDTLILPDTLIQDSLAKDTVVTRLAILLPFQTDAIKRDKSIDRFYDFYAGALIAIYEEQAKGHALEVWSYDVGRTAMEMNRVLKETNIREMDAIIGPAFSQQVSIVADSIKGDSIWMLIPFISNVKEMESHPFLLKFNPSQTVQADTIARYLAQRRDSINCVLLESKEGDVIPSGIRALHHALKRYDVPCTHLSVGAIFADSMDYAMVPDVENILIFNTEKYSNLHSVMPHLLKIYGKYQITLFSQYSWQDERILLPQLYTSVFAPEPQPSEEYERLFDSYFQHDLSSTHPRYDLLGYDLTSQLLHMIHAAEQDSVCVRDTMINHRWEGAQVDIQYMPVSEQGGLENHIVHIIHP